MCLEFSEHTSLVVKMLQKTVIIPSSFRAGQRTRNAYCKLQAYSKHRQNVLGEIQAPTTLSESASQRLYEVCFPPTFCQHHKSVRNIPSTTLMCSEYFQHQLNELGKIPSTCKVFERGYYFRSDLHLTFLILLLTFSLQLDFSIFSCIFSILPCYFFESKQSLCPQPPRLFIFLLSKSIIFIYQLFSLISMIIN